VSRYPLFVPSYSKYAPTNDPRSIEVGHLNEAIPFIPNYAYRRISRYRTTVVQSASGRTETNAHWAAPLHEFALPLNGRKQSELEYILRFFHAAIGRACTFNFVDFYEDRSCSLGDAPSHSDCVIATAEDGQTDFQLYKTYVVGDLTRSRKITRPITDTVSVAVDGVLLSPSMYSVQDGGILSFFDPLAEGQVLTAGFRFAVPVRFGSDDIEQTIHNFRAGFIGDATVTLMEERE